MKLNLKSFFALTLILLGASQTSFAKSTYKIGIAGNFTQASTNTNNQWNKYIYPAVDLAFDHFKKQNPNLDFDVEFIKLDYQGKKELVLNVVKQAQQEQVVAVIGFDQSGFAEIAASRLNNLKIPMITHTATATTIDRNRDYVFRVCFDNQSANKTIVEYIHKNNQIQNVITLVENDCHYCMDYAKTFELEAKKVGIKVTTHQSSEVEGFDWQKIYSEYQSLKNAAFFVPNHERFSALIVSKLVQKFPDALFLGGDGWGDKAELFFKLVKHPNFKAYKIVHWSQFVTTPASKTFTKQFELQFKTSPVESSALMYDAVGLFLKTLKTKPKNQNLKQALINTTPYTGVTGVIDFHQKGSKKALIQKAHQGKFVPIQ